MTMIGSSLLVLGVHDASEGYPNTLYRLIELRARYAVTEINAPIRPRDGSYKYGRGRCKSLVRAISAHLAVIIRYFRSSEREVAYVPYPAVFLLYLFSFMPRKVRPRRLVADAFISIYDTVVNDRKLLAPKGWAAHFLKLVERRAYAVASKVIVDTDENRSFYSDLFDLPHSKFVVVPLSTNESDFHLLPYQPTSTVTRVLFIGTMVPLQGVGTIIGAIEMLTNRPDIHFKLIGDGQDSALVASRIRRLSNVDWEQDWQPSEVLAHEIGSADICLGIFGVTEKTQRVCPLKIYAYASVGRAVVTSDSAWMRRVAAERGGCPFVTVQAGDAAALATQIALLADNRERRAELAKESSEFYEEKLANECAMSLLQELLSKQ